MRVSIASRVVPAISDTITLSSPTMAFTSDDLPTFGRPITAIRAAWSSPGASASATSSDTRSSRSPVPSPWVADTGTGSPRPSA